MALKGMHNPERQIMKIASVDIFGDEAEIDHVGIAVESIDTALPDAEKVVDGIQDVSVAFVSIHGMTMELVEPNSDTSPISNLMSKGSKLLHICYRVPDIDAAIRKARKHGVHLISQPVPAVAFDNRKIAWLYSKTYGLLELVEGPE